jgi:hypothetical protein
MSSILLLLFLAIPYFFPTIVALGKGYRNVGVMLLFNLFFGWTILGWLIALICAANVKETISTPATNPKNPNPKEGPYIFGVLGVVACVVLVVGL